MLSTGVQFCVQVLVSSPFFRIIPVECMVLKMIEEGKKKKKEPLKPSEMFSQKLDHGDHGVLWPLHESRSIYKTASVLKSLSSAWLLRTSVFFIFHANEQVSSINKTKETFCQTSTVLFFFLQLQFMSLQLHRMAELGDM